MEGVPRMPMIHFELKINDQKSNQMATDLLTHIRNYYHEDPKDYLQEISILEKLRAWAMRPTKDMEGCAILKRYYCQLCFLMKKLPVLKDGTTVQSEEVSWKELWWSSSSPKHVNFRVDYFCVLYNIGALHSLLGAEDDRTTTEGLKLACTHFQCAAWAFQHLNTTTLKSNEFDPRYFSFLVAVCLAQAQECILEKSMTDNRKPIISAKVAAQVAEYYGTAMNSVGNKVEDILFNDKVTNVWISYATAKRAYYESISYLFLGIHAEEEEKMGERVTYYNAACDKLNNVNIPKFQEAEFHKKFEDSLNFTRDVIEAKKKISINENDFIYHEPVPLLEKLPKTRGAVLVRPIPVNCSDPDICGPDIFSRLIPMKVHKVSSIYSEEKAKLLRGIITAVEEKDAELNLVMDSFKIDSFNFDDLNVLPDELVERCAACDTKTDLIPNLLNAMNTLSDEHHEVESMMSEIMKLIEEEEKAEKEYQQIIGTSRPPSIVATDLTCEAKKYTEALSKALESNQTLHKAITLHINNLKILSSPLEEIQKQLPKISVNYSSEDSSILKELDRLVQKVEQMKSQRATLVNKLRESIQNDDISSQLVLSDEKDSAEIITKELEKHHNTAKLIDQNLAAQENILKALTDTYASYGPIRKQVNQLIQKRSSFINALIESFDEYEDVISKASKGIEFYNKLEVNVRKLLQRVKGTCKVQEEERQQIYAKSTAKDSKENLAVADPAFVNNSSLKLKHYIKQKPFSVPKSDISSPYNPYYNAQNNYNATVATTTASMSVPPVSGAEVNSQQYYSCLVRPAPVGSEMTKTSSAMNEQNVSAYPANATVTSSVYSPAKQPTSTYVAPNQNDNPSQHYLKSGYNSAIGGGQSYNSVDPYYGATAAYHSPYGAAVASGNVPNMSSQQYNVATTHGSYATPAASFSVSNTALSHANYNSFPTQATYVTVYNPASSYSTAQYYPSTTSTPTYYQQSNTGNYTTPYRNYSNIPNTYAIGPYAQTTLTSTPQIYSSVNYSGSSSGAATSEISVVQNNLPKNYYSVNAVGAYPGYNNTAATSPAESQLGQHRMLTVDRGNAGNVSAWQTSSQYPQQIHLSTNYGAMVTTILPHNHYTTANAGSSKGADVGCSSVLSQSRTYASTYPASAESVNEPNPVNPSYFTQQYGYQHFNAVNNVPAVVTSVLQVTPNSLTYMQAAASTDSTASTYSRKTSTASSSSENNQKGTDDATAEKSNDVKTNVANATAAVKKVEQSYVDLLADLDFNVSDPVLPVTVVDKTADSTTALKDEITDKLDSLDVSECSSEVKSNCRKTDQGTTLSIEKKKAASFTSALLDPTVLNQLVCSTEKFEKFVDRLTMKMLNGSTLLDTIWNDYSLQQDKHFSKRSKDAANKNSSRNRYCNDVPYDANIVRLSSDKIDYINASFVKIPKCTVPNFIVTETPMSSTYEQFWEMIWEFDVEQIICLVTENEIQDGAYWPKEKSEKFEFSDLKVLLRSVHSQSFHTERIISLIKGDISRVVTHLQIGLWSESIIPREPSPLLELISESISLYRTQCDLDHHIVVHGLSASGRTGLFILLLTAISEVDIGAEVPELITLLMTVSESRKNIIENKQNLLLAFQGLAAYVDSLLIKYGERGLVESKKEVTVETVPKNVDTSSAVNSSTEISHSQYSNKEINNVDLLSKSTAISGSESKNFDRLLSKEENKRRNMERFSTVNSLEAIVPDQSSSDPLNSIDPLWPIKKQQT